MCAQSTRLSPVDAAWYQMEHPTNLMMITGVLLMRGPLNVARIRATFEARLLQFRRFRQRVVQPALGIGLPFWEDDPNFDLDSHIFHIALPKRSASESSDPHDVLMEMLSDIAAMPLDLARPLWSAHLVDDVTLEDGTPGSALIMRLHHCMGDGTAMVAVAMRLMDTDPDAGIEIPSPHKAHKHRSLLGKVAGTATWLLGETRNAVSTVLHEGVASIADPGRLVEMGSAAAEFTAENASMIARALAKPNDPITPLKGKLGVAKRVAVSRPVTLAATKEICVALGCKVNDVLVAAMAGGLRRYLAERETEVEGLDLNAVVPINLRSPGRELDLGNVFGLVFLGMPVGLADPLERLRTIKERMDALKASGEAIFYYSLLNLFGLTPRSVEDVALAYFGSKATGVFTNVMGPRETIYLAGQEVEKMMFWVPQSGRLALGISIFSYNGKVTLGVMTDAGIIPDPERIVAGFDEEFQLLRRVAEVKRAADTQSANGGAGGAMRSASAMRMQCIATNRNGTPCRNLARPGASYCHLHAPA